MHKLTIEQFIHRYNQKFKNAYEILTPPEKFSGQSLVEILCDKHGKSNRKVSELLGCNHACCQCGKDARTQSNKKNADAMEIPFAEHIIRFRKIHGDLYKYPPQEFKNSHSKIKIICSNHGEFLLHMHSHVSGVGCPTCRHETTKAFSRRLIPREIRIQPTIDANRKRQTPLSVIERRCQENHGNKFKYNWADYLNHPGKIKVICEKHGETTQLVKEHLKSKYGCPSCAKYATSIGEKLWISRFDITDTQYRIITDKSFVKVDGYDSKTNTIYEYLGNYWHGHPTANSSRLSGINGNNKMLFTELFRLTEDRFRLLKSLGYNILYVWENDITHHLTDFRIFKERLEYD